MGAVTANHYQVLGVAPAADEVVIRAAYRALMRIYHPDRNDDPNAQARARQITAAFAVLGDPERRAAYDAREAFCASEQRWAAADRRSPPPMRNLGVASIAVALAVSLAFALPTSRSQPEPDALRDLAAYRGIAHTAPVAVPASPPAKTMAHTAAAVPPSMPSTMIAVPPPPPPPGAAPEPPASRSLPASAPAPRIARVERVTRPPAAAAAQTANTAPASKPESSPAADGRREQVERLASGFLKQSLEHADWRKQQLLLSARNRSATTRNMCRSDDCVTEAYLRQIRDTTTIMEGRIPNP